MKQDQYRWSAVMITSTLVRGFQFRFLQFQQKKKIGLYKLSVRYFYSNFIPSIPILIPSIPTPIPSIPRIPTPIPRIPTHSPHSHPIPRIPRISRIPTPIPRIPTPIPRIPTQIPRIPTPIRGIPTPIPLMSLILFPDSPFRLLQIAAFICV